MTIECNHKLRFCKDCGLVWCEKCGSNWHPIKTYWYTSYPEYLTKHMQIDLPCKPIEIIVNVCNHKRE